MLLCLSPIDDSDWASRARA